MLKKATNNVGASHIRYSSSRPICAQWRSRAYYCTGRRSNHIPFLCFWEIPDTWRGLLAWSRWIFTRSLMWRVRMRGNISSNKRNSSSSTTTTTTTTAAAAAIRSAAAAAAAARGVRNWRRNCRIWARRHRKNRSKHWPNELHSTANTQLLLLKLWWSLSRMHRRSAAATEQEKQQQEEEELPPLTWYKPDAKRQKVEWIVLQGIFTGHNHNSVSTSLASLFAFVVACFCLLSFWWRMLCIIHACQLIIVIRFLL